MGQHIVIAGGGFGGFYTAKKLEKTAPSDATITLVTDVNFMLYTPLLPGAAAGTLDPRHVVMPLRDHLKRTNIRVGSVVDGDPSSNTLSVDLVSGEHKELKYDQLVIALGSVSRTFPIPGLTEHAIGFKTIGEATALRNRLVKHLELAECLDDPEARKPYLTFVFVGGGYAGLEGMAELQHFAKDALKRYPRCREVGTRFLLVDVAERIMMEMKPTLAEFTMKVLKKRGIEFQLGTSISEVQEAECTLTSGEVVPTRTVVWTAGVKASPVAEHLGLPLDRGRIEVDETMQVKGFKNVWALGDIAAVPDPARPGFPCPPTAQHAIRQGKVLGKNIVSAMKGGPLAPFRYKTLGAFADLGRHTAVANMMGIRLKGFVAWAVARFYHLAWMPGLDRKSRLIADWSVEILFPRDTAEMGALSHRVRLGDPGPTPPAAPPDPQSSALEHQDTAPAKEAAAEQAAVVEESKAPETEGEEAAAK
jgi:NADH:ubiquinone reductase (H+-translocating)